MWRGREKGEWEWERAFLGWNYLFFYAERNGSMHWKCWLMQIRRRKWKNDGISKLDKSHCTCWGLVLATRQGTRRQGAWCASREASRRTSAVGWEILQDCSCLTFYSTQLEIVLTSHTQRCSEPSRKHTHFSWNAYKNQLFAWPFQTLTHFK